MDVLEPTVLLEDFAGQQTEVHSHPAFAQVSVSHVQGTACLYGSDFEHKNFVVLTIKGSEMRRDLSRDWHHERGYIAQVAMSEAQYATMISAPNRTGVPCTLTMKGGEQIPGLPHRDSKKQYDAEIMKTLRETLANLEKQRDEMKAAASKMPKKVQDQILAAINKAILEIGQNLPFIVTSFERHMEETVEKAKVEVSAYATNTVMRAGIETLAGGAPVLSIASANEQRK